LIGYLDEKSFYIGMSWTASFADKEAVRLLHHPSIAITGKETRG
jgi:hypothetical protein